MSTKNTETATFAAGCFWGVEETFRTLPGVLRTEVGYTGGQTAKPTYELVCTDKTGHAEAVNIEFDPSKISYETLLNKFWKCHDPTQVNRQGPDEGTQYRTAIFTHSDAQRIAAESSKKALIVSGKHAQPIVTAIEPAAAFYRAEEYHQQYIFKGGSACHLR